MGFRGSRVQIPPSRLLQHQQLAAIDWPRIRPTRRTFRRTFSQGRSARLTRETQVRHRRDVQLQTFISEDDLKTFDGWLKYQGFDAATLTPEDLTSWRAAFEEMQKLKAAGGPKVGLMKLPPLVRGEY